MPNSRHFSFMARAKGRESMEWISAGRSARREFILLR